MNPAVDSRWIFCTGIQDYTFTVVGIWGTGIKDKYRVENYEIRKDGNIKTQLLSAERLAELINERKIKPL